MKKQKTQKPEISKIDIEKLIAERGVVISRGTRLTDGQWLKATKNGGLTFSTELRARILALMGDGNIFGDLYVIDRGTRVAVKLDTKSGHDSHPLKDSMYFKSPVLRITTPSTGRMLVIERGETRRYEPEAIDDEKRLFLFKRAGRQGEYRAPAKKKL